MYLPDEKYTSLYSFPILQSPVMDSIRNYIGGEIIVIKKHSWA